MSYAAKMVDSKATKRPNGIDFEIGRRLRKWRIAQDIDACDLARTVGVTYQQLQKYEKGQTRIAASRLFEISQALSVPVDWFFQEPGIDSEYPIPASSPEPSSDGHIHRYSGHRLLRHYLLIDDPDIRRAFAELMETLAAPKSAVPPVPADES